MEKNKKFKSKKKLNSVLIQNYEVLVIDHYLQAKLQRFADYKVRYSCAMRKESRKFLAVVQIY